MRIVEVPRGSSFVEKTAVAVAPSRARRSVTQRPPRRRCSCTVLPANDEPAFTCVDRRPRVSTVSETDGATPTVSDGLVPPFALASYDVRIAGRACALQLPPAPVTTVATDLNDVSPNASASTVTLTPD